MAASTYGVNNRRRRIYDMTGGRCYYCGCQLDYHDFEIDHFLPRVRGGKDKNNCVPSCRDCNSLKSDLDIETFRTRVEALIFTTRNGRLISKYFGAEPQHVEFFFERYM